MVIVWYWGMEAMGWISSARRVILVRVRGDVVGVTTVWIKCDCMCYTLNIFFVRNRIAILCMIYSNSVKICNLKTLEESKCEDVVERECIVLGLLSPNVLWCCRLSRLKFPTLNPRIFAIAFFGWWFRVKNRIMNIARVYSVTIENTNSSFFSPPTISGSRGRLVRQSPERSARH